MAKRLKQRLSRVIPSLQLCRPNKSDTLLAFPGNTIPAIHRLTPVNPKSFDISFPSLTTPAPPSTPDRSFTWSGCPRGSKLFDPELPLERTLKKDNGSQDMVSKSRERTTRFATSANKHRKKVVREDAQALLLSRSPRSFSDDYPSTDFFSERSSSTETTGETSVSSSSSSSGLQRLMPGEPKGRVKESVAVVKKSEDPLEDFKRSMLEMVVEKEMFAAEDLEQLLRCFLSLNSRKYHPVIVEAFSEIWQLLFSDHL